MHNVIFLQIMINLFFSPHPYLFFNSDRFTFTFLGFYIDRATGNLVDQQTGTVLENAILTQNLFDALVRNHVPITEHFDNLPRFGFFYYIVLKYEMK